MRFAIFIAAAIALQACSGTTEGSATKDDSLLSTDLVHNPNSAAGTQASARELPVVSFADTAHDFGTIREGEVVEYAFRFTNTGKAPLLITGANASCGCTVPEYPREPMAPGASGTIQVAFNSKGKPGHQEKTVTVTSNAAAGVQLLTIAAEVTPATE